MSDTSVLVIGLDAACFEQLDPLLSDGDLPHLESILESGVSAPLETTTPPWTPSAWPSVVTGSRPWTHGVYDFYDYGEAEPHQVSAREVQVPFVWEILSACDVGSIVVNVPVTHPPHDFEGSLVPGYIAPETTDCLVDGRRVPIDSLDDSYRIYPHADSSDRSKLGEYRELVASRATVAETLAERHPWSFMMVQFQSTDAVFHSMGDDESAIRGVFRAVDSAIGQLLDTVDESTHVFVVSDHGMHRYERVFHCNSWLRDREYLETTADSSRYSWNERARSELVEGDDPDGLVSTATGALVRGARRVGITPSRLERALTRIGLDEYVVGVLPESVLIDVVDAGEHVDWAESRAFCRSSASLGIRCNVVGRDPDGVVPPDEFDDLRSRIVGELRTLTDPTGQQVFDRVYDRHQIHGGDVANERSAPDIVLRPADMTWEITDVVRERTYATTTEYNHSDEGMFAASGECIDGTATIRPSVVDVVPTILALFGIEPLETMDGRVPDGLLRRTPPGREPPAIGEREFIGEQRSEGVSETVEDQLREMGYIQ